MPLKQQMFGSCFVLALVGVIAVSASTLLRADEGNNPLVIPNPMPVVSAAPLQVTAPNPLPVSVQGTVPVSVAPPVFEYTVVSVESAFSNVQPGFDTRIQTILTPLGAGGWEFVKEVQKETGSERFWIFRRVPR